MAKSSNNKAQLCAIGEHLVAIELLKHGYDAILANMSINNIQSYDIVCVNPETNKTVLVQVKTSVKSVIPVGFNIGNAVTVYLQSKIVGPWVFVYLDGKGTPHFYVLSRNEVIRLINDSNYWYKNKWKNTYRKKEVKSTNPVGICIKWLEGEGEEENEKHLAFDNPLRISSKNNWNKIWED